MNNYFRYSPRGRGFPTNFDLDIWKFGVSVAKGRYPLVFISWAREWILNSDDPHNVYHYNKTRYEEWYLCGLELGGRWAIVK